MFEKTHNPNTLDPGRLHARKRSISSCTCLLYLALIAIVLIVIRFFTVTIYAMIENAQSPHKAIYQNVTSMEEVKNRANVVQPLVGEGQKFDVAATVWVRDSTYEGEGADGDGIRNERALFSDVVFRDLTLKDKNKYTSVHFQLPLSIFREENLTNYDVRASFSLIPHHPSLLDHAVNFSSWFPDSITVPPVRTWPFPLGSTSERERTFEDEAIDSYGISIPLIEFYGIHSKCSSLQSSSTSTATTSVSSQTGPDSAYEEDELEEDTEEEEKEESDDKQKHGRPRPDDTLLKASSSLKTSTGDSALKLHPYLITRTQIRVIDETRLYNRKSYNKAHKSLKSRSCGQGVAKVTPNYYMCTPPRMGRWFSDHGNFETRFELDMGSEEGKGGSTREWAYAPFLTTLHNAAGHLDILPLPVNREKCKFHRDSETSVEKEPDFIPVEWKLSFSGRTPAKHAIANYLQPWTVGMNHTESEYEMQKKHGYDELINGALGHRFNQEAHPRRMLLLDVTATVLGFARGILDAHYWYTRSTTYSLSVIGYLMISLGNVVEATAISFANYETFWGWLIAFLLVWVMAPTSLLQLKAITRIEFGWRNGGHSWIPSVSVAPASHRERASERADSSLHWTTKSAIFLSFLVFYHFLTPTKYYILSPLHVLPSPSDEPFSQSRWVKYAVTINNALSISGTIFQWMLNRKLRVFSGRYKISLWLTVARCLAQLCRFIPLLVGKEDLRAGVSVAQGLAYLSVAAEAWQAWRFPSAKQDEEDDSTQ